MKTIALTGATSMIGLAIIKQCIKQSINVIAFVRPNSSRINLLPKSNLITIISCYLDELKNFDSVKNDLNKPEVFYHLGWDYTNKQERDNNYKQLSNIHHTLSAVQLAAKLGCNRFVGAGSQAEYGSSLKPLAASTPVNPDIAYGIAKYAAGKFAKIECDKFKLEYIWVRILSVYGIHDNYNTLIKTFILNCKNNHPMALGHCTHIWDYLHEDDAGPAFLAVGEKGKNGNIYCLGSGIGKPLREYLETMKKIINPIYTLQYGEIPYTEKSVLHLCADITELTKDTGWKPEISFEVGIKRVIESSK